MIFSRRHGSHSKDKMPLPCSFCDEFHILNENMNQLILFDQDNWDLTGRLQQIEVSRL